jgi:hypothetical protein
MVNFGRLTGHEFNSFRLREAPYTTPFPPPRHAWNVKNTAQRAPKHPDLGNVLQFFHRQTDCNVPSLYVVGLETRQCGSRHTSSAFGARNYNGIERVCRINHPSGGQKMGT